MIKRIMYAGALVGAVGALYMGKLLQPVFDFVDWLLK